MRKDREVIGGMVLEACLDALTRDDLICTILLTFPKGGGLGHARQRIIKVNC